MYISLPFFTLNQRLTVLKAASRPFSHHRALSHVYYHALKGQYKISTEAYNSFLERLYFSAKYLAFQLSKTFCRSEGNLFIEIAANRLMTAAPYPKLRVS
jgi:hypothetical protein